MRAMQDEDDASSSEPDWTWDANGNEFAGTIDLALADLGERERQVAWEHELLGGELEEARARVELRSAADVVTQQLARIADLRNQLHREARSSDGSIDAAAYGRVFNVDGDEARKIADGFALMRRRSAKRALRRLNRLDQALLKVFRQPQMAARLEGLSAEWKGFEYSKLTRDDSSSPVERKRALALIADHAIVLVLRALHRNQETFLADKFASALLEIVGGSAALDSAASWLWCLQLQVMRQPPRPPALPMDDELSRRLADWGRIALLTPEYREYEAAQEANDRVWRRQQLIDLLLAHSDGSGPSVREVLAGTCPPMSGPQDAARLLIARATEAESGGGVSASSMRDYRRESDLDWAFELISD